MWICCGLCTFPGLLRREANCLAMLPLAHRAHQLNKVRTGQRVHEKCGPQPSTQARKGPLHCTVVLLARSTCWGLSHSMLVISASSDLHPPEDYTCCHVHLCQSEQWAGPPQPTPLPASSEAWAAPEAYSRSAWFPVPLDAVPSRILVPCWGGLKGTL